MELKGIMQCVKCGVLVALVAPGLMVFAVPSDAPHAPITILE
mgnify:CR=1 FL=1